MVDWDDFVVLEDFVAVIKLNHVLAGLYIWEIILTADFELDVLRGKRPYRWTIWLYLGTRYITLSTFILFLIDTDSRAKLPCQFNRFMASSLPAGGALHFLLHYRLTSSFKNLIDVDVSQVLLMLNLNKPMNDAFLSVTMTIMSIGATRMHRSLFQHVFSTEYVSVKLPQVSQRNPQNEAANIRAHIHFASETQSNETVARSARASAFILTDHIQLEFPPDTSIPKDLDVNPPPLSKGEHSPAPPSPDIEQQAHRQFD
ncbi:hypothetical protein BGW80DRAFT_1463601 [Lactifluus volemus]|nr:hypothetical protein BGW80DRAFT_1463601 [Lactifluus volemus]